MNSDKRHPRGRQRPWFKWSSALALGAMSWSQVSVLSAETSASPSQGQVAAEEMAPGFRQPPRGLWSDVDHAASKIESAHASEPAKEIIKADTAVRKLPRVSIRRRIVDVLGLNTTTPLTQETQPLIAADASTEPVKNLGQPQPADPPSIARGATPLLPLSNGDDVHLEQATAEASSNNSQEGAAIPNEETAATTVPHELRQPAAVLETFEATPIADAPPREQQSSNNFQQQVAPAAADMKWVEGAQVTSPTPAVPIQPSTKPGYLWSLSDNHDSPPTQSSMRPLPAITPVTPGVTSIPIPAISSPSIETQADESHADMRIIAGEQGPLNEVPRQDEPIREFPLEEPQSSAAPRRPETITVDTPNAVESANSFGTPNSVEVPDSIATPDTEESADCVATPDSAETLTPIAQTHPHQRPEIIAIDPNAGNNSLGLLASKIEVISEQSSNVSRPSLIVPIPRGIPALSRLTGDRGKPDETSSGDHANSEAPMTPSEFKADLVIESHAKSMVLEPGTSHDAASEEAKDPPEVELITHSKVDLELRQTSVVRTANQIERAEVVDEDICDVVQFTPHEVSIIGKREGQTHVRVWFKGQNDEESTNYLVAVGGAQRIAVSADEEYSKLAKTLSDLYPDVKVQLIDVGDKLVVKGTVHSSAEASEILSLIRRLRLIPVVDRLVIERR